MYLKGRGVNSGLRLIYAHFEEKEEIIENDQVIQKACEAKIIMVELYHKKDKATEDQKRIKRNFQ